MAIPNCAGRFPDLCKTEFPAVTNYDYETNYATRGIDNRDFRWEDIQVESSWLFLEATASGSFENNSFHIVGGVTGSTGRWYVTTGSVADTVSYSPWIVSGGYSVYVPTSGAVLNQFNLPGFTGEQFWANPIEGNQSIGLYCQSSSIPKVYCLPIDVDPTGIDNSQNHQVFLMATCNYHTGVTPRLKVYLQALAAGSVVGYYDPTASEWTANYPTGYYSIPDNEYTEIKFQFNPSASSLTVADHYSLHVETDSTGAFITIDDIHIDQYLEKNPYVDVIIPEGYMIQISPDLGWHDKEELLNQVGNFVNPFLKTLGPFSTTNGNLIDNMDGSVTASIDLADFEKATTARYSKYVWRAFAVGPNGDLGNSSDPEHFTFIGSDVDQDFTITDVMSDSLSSEKVIIGTKSARMSVVIDDITSYPHLSYPSPTTWRLQITVVGEKQTLKIFGRDDGGATSTIHYVDLVNVLYDQKTEAIWNTFDEHGVMADIKRLPSESNYDYSERIKDSFTARGGSTFVGLANSSSRELGFTRIASALRISIPKNEFGLNIHESVMVEFGSVHFRARTPEMIYSETLQVDPEHGTVTLSKFGYDAPISIVTEDGIVVPGSAVQFEQDDDMPSICRLKIHYPKVYGKFVKIEYPYFEEILYKNAPTLGDLQERIEDLTDHIGSRLVVSELDMQLSGGEDCLGLYIASQEVSADIVMSVPWTPITIRRISDKSFREYFLEPGKSYRDSKFYTYISELKSNSRTLWGSVQADRDYWDAADKVDQSFDHVPTLMDPIMSSYVSFTGDSSKFVDAGQAWGRAYIGKGSEVLVNNGIDHTLFHPGVAHTSDLTPGIATYYNSQIVLESQRQSVSDAKQDNNFILFSGQR